MSLSQVAAQFVGLIALVLKYAPELDLRIRSYWQLTNDSWRADETYIQVKGEWKYLYRAVDAEGNTLDEKTLPQAVELRTNKYLNNVVEPDHRNVKRIVKPTMGFKSFNTARRTLRGIAAMNMLRKGQIQGSEKSDTLGQVEFVSQIFRVAA